MYIGDRSCSKSSPPSVANNANKQHGFQLLGRRTRRGRLKVLYRASQFMHTNREKTETCSFVAALFPVSARLVAAGVSGKKRRPVPVDFERQFSRNQVDVDTVPTVRNGGEDEKNRGKIERGRDIFLGLEIHF